MAEGIKNQLKAMVLKGPVREWWIRKRSRELEQSYIQHVQSAYKGFAVPETPKTTTTTPRRPLRRVLFMGDLMWEQDNLFPELERFCPIDTLDFGPALKTRGERAPSEVLAECIRLHTLQHGEPDAVFLYARPSILSDEVFSALRARWSCPLLGMNLDDKIEYFPHGILASGNDGYCRWAKHFDMNLTSSRGALDWYHAAGFSARYVPQGFCRDPRWAEPPTRADFRYGLSFVGSIKPERAQLVTEIQNAGLAISLFGSGWPNGTWIEVAGEVFRDSQINLGIGLVGPTGGLVNPKGRDIECPATGACYLTTYHWELAGLYDIGKEILCYRNFEELVDIYQFYIRRPQLCLALAQAAHARCHAEHTWEARLRPVFRDLGFAV